MHSEKANKHDISSSKQIQRITDTNDPTKGVVSIRKASPNLTPNIRTLLFVHYYHVSVQRALYI